MNRALLIALCCGGILWMTAEGGESEPQEKPEVTAAKPMSFWMAKKLDHSKEMLEALTSADFDRLVETAEQLQFIGKFEGFVRGRNEAYVSQLKTFELANRELIRQAERRNVEGATLAFNQLTSSCVACHVQLREGATTTEQPTKSGE